MGNRVNRLQDPSLESEFTGVPGVFGNTDRGEPLSPRLEKTALMQTKPAESDSVPSHGTGGIRLV